MSQERLNYLRNRRAELVQALQHLNADLAHLAIDVKSGLHEAIAPRETKLEQKRRIEEELREVNAELKELNVAAMSEAKRTADVKRTAGMEEFAANEARADARASAKHGFDRGDFLQNNARRMRMVIRAIKNPLPHTVEFLTALDRFIAAQSKHIAERNLARARDEGES
jgi:hypothetical protein